MFTISLIRNICGKRSLNSCVYLSTSSVRYESPLASLRRKTGFALNLCKKALAANENDLSKAESWLKEEAKRNGWQKANQLQNRRAAEGLVGVYVNANNRSGVLLEVNCESDFVARNDIFRDLVSQLTLKIASATIVKGTSNKTNDGNLSPLRKYPIRGEDLKLFEDTIAETITQLGENIKLRRATLIENRRHKGSDGTVLTGYAHAVGGLSNTLNGVSLGKYGTVLAFREVEPKVSPTAEAAKGEANNPIDNSIKEGEEQDPDAFAVLEQGESNLVADDTSREQVAKLLCQHIIGVKPTTLARTVEQQQKLDERRQLAKSIKDKTEKPLLEEDDFEPALLEQKFLINESVTVKQLCTERGLELVDFERYECGQELKE